METIYIDILIVINFIIDFLILDMVRMVLNINVTYKRIIISSLISAVTSLVILMPNYPSLLNIAISALIIFISYGKCRFKTYLKRLTCFYAINFGFSGIIIAIYMCSNNKEIIFNSNYIYFYISPISLIILTLICYIILYFVKRIMGKQLVAERICTLSVKIFDKQYNFKAKVDTCCDLKEPFSNNPVIVAEKSLFSNNIITENNVRLVPFSSLGGEGILKAVKIDELIIDNTLINKIVYLGLCNNILHGEVKALIPNDIIGDE